MTKTEINTHVERGGKDSTPTATEHLSSKDIRPGIGDDSGRGEERTQGGFQGFIDREDDRGGGSDQEESTVYLNIAIPSRNRQSRFKCLEHK